MQDWFYGDGHGWLGWATLLTWWVVIMLLGLAVAHYFINGHYGRPRHTETALDILKKRYASGEISKEEFEKMRKDLES